MGWQLINSKIGDDCFGYLIGDGTEDGFYCFEATPYFSHYDRPVISDSYFPRLEVSAGGSRDTFERSGIDYNGNPVWGSVFYSVSERAWVYGLTSRYDSNTKLREPVYYTDLDGETVIGDSFFEGNYPGIGYTVTWTSAGAPGNLREVSASLVQDVWAWHDNGGISKSKSGFAGRYYNQADGTWKFVGIPSFEVRNGGEGCRFDGETFVRSSTRDARRNLVYVGDRGDQITKHRASGKWIIGTSGNGAWSVSDAPPGLNADAHFDGFSAVSAGATPEADESGTFDLQWIGNAMGDEKREVLMGEVSLWRTGLT